MGPQAVAVLGWTLAALSALTVLPQLLRLRSTGSTAGVSATSAGLATATMWAWCVYTVEIRDLPALASSLAALLVWAAVLGVVLLRRRDQRSAILGGGVLLAVLLVPASGAAVLCATAGSLLWILPQALRTLRTGSLHAVSAGAYLLVLAENLGWLLYALLTDRPAYAVAPLVQVPLSALIAWRARRHRDDPDRPPVPNAALDAMVTAP